jgi:hypothetical protein
MLPRAGEMAHAVIQELRSHQIPYAIVTAYPDDVMSHVGGVVIPKPVNRGMLERWVAGLPAPEARKHESGR